MLLIFGLLAIAMPFAANLIASQRGLSVTDRKVALPLVGAELVIIGYGLTPGIGWGRPGEHPAINTLSTILWLGGITMLGVAAVKWRRHRRRR